MKTRWPPAFACFLTIAGCGQATDTPRDSASSAETGDRERETVFDPLTETLDRAEGVEDTVLEHDQELRRRIEEAEQ